MRFLHTIIEMLSSFRNKVNLRNVGTLEDTVYDRNEIKLNATRIFILFLLTQQVTK